MAGGGRTTVEKTSGGGDGGGQNAPHPDLLQECQPLRLLQALFTGLSLGLFTLRVCQAGARLRQHLLLVLVHIDGIRPRGLDVRVRVDFSRPQTASVRGLRGIAIASRGLRSVQQLLVVLKALRSRPPDDRRNGPPLRWHELGKVEQFLLLLARPLRLLDAGVEPLIPTCLALFGRLPVQQRCNTGPLVGAILHHRRLENLILRVAPRAALDEDARHVGVPLRGSGTTAVTTGQPTALWRLTDRSAGRGAPLRRPQAATARITSAARSHCQVQTAACRCAIGYAVPPSQRQLCRQMSPSPRAFASCAPVPPSSMEPGRCLCNAGQRSRTRAKHDATDRNHLSLRQPACAVRSATAWASTAPVASAAKPSQAAGNPLLLEFRV